MSNFWGSLHSSNVEFSLEDVCRIESPVAHAGGDFKKALVPVETRKAWAPELQARHLVSIVKSCQAVCISRTAYYHRKQSASAAITK